MPTHSHQTPSISATTNPLRDGSNSRWTSSPEPTLFLELLRFRNLLRWIAQVVDKALAADDIQGIDLETYQRLTAGC